MGSDRRRRARRELTALPSRGDVWLVDLNPGRGHEQVGTRPALVISATIFSRGPADLVVVLPVTTRERGIPLHVRIEPPEGGVRETSFVQCEDIRSVSRERLIERWGAVFPETLARTEGALRVLLEL